MENENEIVIGIRGDAKQGRTATILYYVLGILFILLGIGLLSIIEDKDAPYATFPAVFWMTFGTVFFLYGFVALNTVRNNKKILDKPVLVYDKEKNVFIGYNSRKKNEMIIIPNGRIFSVKGSAFATGRELFITYLNDKNKKTKSSFGFCRNIDGGAFKALLNQYHNPKIQ